ncbi:hypothetical protein HY523_01255, partial [Candidatus Berkelbacteria bacterium]|nr:hypothetical protein [Candidatus Berkelbacteria bacterium]
MVIVASSKWIITVIVVVVATISVAGGLVYLVKRASQQSVSTKTLQPSSSPSQSLAEIISSSTASSALPSTAPITSAAISNSQVTSASSKKTTTACTSIEKLLSTFEQTTPTWEQLDCYFADVTRLPTPAYFTKMNVDYDAHRGDRTSLVTIYRDLWDAYMREYGSNVSPANGAGMPPYVGTDGQPLSYPLSTDNFDAKMRGVAVAYLGEKAKGRRINFQNFHPPDQIA